MFKIMMSELNPRRSYLRDIRREEFSDASASAIICRGFARKIYLLFFIALVSLFLLFVFSKEARRGFIMCFITDMSLSNGNKRTRNGIWSLDI